MSSDDHLEEALREYNERIERLETEGSVSDLLEAYINRGTVFMLMESYISADGDFEDAIDIIEDEEAAGNPVDVGLYIRAYESRGQMNRGSDDLVMLSDYRKIASRLPELDTSTRYFQLKDIVRLCTGCAEDLMDESHWNDALPFVEKGIEIISGKLGVWEDNRRADLYSLRAEIADSTGRPADSEKDYSRSIDIESFLDREGGLEDRYRLVLDYIARGEVRSDAGDDDGALSDHLAACTMLEEMVEDGRSDDRKLLADLCQAIASMYMEKGMLPESQKYLVKGLRYGAPAVDHAIDALGIERSE